MIEAVFDEAGCAGFLHAVEVDGDDGGREVAHHADSLVVTASVFKIAVLLEVCRRFASGALDARERVVVTDADRVLGPTGLSVMCDDVELSLRDLAFLMMSVSDNTATDVLMRYVGVRAINDALAEVGLERTVLVGDCAALLADAPDTVEGLPQWGSLDPERTTRTTPREITRLLSMIWREEAAPAEACAEVRRIMALQVWPHRLSSGFPAGVQIAGKTGSLPGIRNEAGVVTYPDGRSFAVAVFTRARTYDSPQPAIDAAIGRAAHFAVEHLRSTA